MGERFFMLDTMALVFRAHFAFISNPRITSSGMNTSAAFGFFTTVFDVIQNENPEYLCAALESTIPTFRHQIFSEYKGRRDETPEAIVAGLPYVLRFLRAMRIPAPFADGYEADDVIGTLSVAAAQAGVAAYLMTPDKDYAQLVRPGVFVYRPGWGKKNHAVLDVQGVISEYGVEPRFIPDWLALIGDAADNIPGVPGIGEKTAVKLINRFGDIESIFQNLHRIREQKIVGSKVLDSLAANQDLCRQGRMLNVIKTDVPVPTDPEEYRRRPPDFDALFEIFRELEMRTLAARVEKMREPSLFSAAVPSSVPLPDATPPSSAPSDRLPDPPVVFQTLNDIPHDYRLCADDASIETVLRELSGAEGFCFDTETTGLDPLSAQIVGLSLSAVPFKAYFVPLPADPAAAAVLLSRFRPLFADPHKEKIAQNLKFDLHILANYGVEVSPPYFDTMLAHYVCHSTARHNMDALAQQYLRYRPISFEELVGGAKNKKNADLRSLPPERLMRYACEDADVTLRLAEPLKREAKTFGVERVLYEVEIPLVNVLMRMERNGVAIDVDFLKEYSLELSKEMERLSGEIQRLAGVAFNVNSPRQLGEVLFTRLKIAAGKKTATGQFSTDEATLAALAAQGHELPARVLEYREIAKLKSTYVDALPAMIHPRTGRVHTDYSQAVAATGRLSSNNPNLQNIPIRTERGKEVRKAFVAPPGKYIVSADYSQIELRLMAEMSGDENMIAAFRAGEDIHRATAARIFGVAPEQVNADMRRKAKTVNFGIIYGMSSFGLAERLGISRTEAKLIIESYFAQYPGVKRYMSECVERARAEGAARTLLGRAHRLPDLHSTNHTVRSVAERNAINTPIQGSAADLIKLAMIRIARRLEEMEMESAMIMQVHDELVFEVPEAEVDKLRALAIEEMVGALPGLKTPIVVETGVGDNWLEAH
jgi:DNA polymerase-1